MSFITIEEYNKNNNYWFENSSIEVCRAFQPIAFKNLSFKSEINKLSELRFFIDTQHHVRYYEWFEKYIEGITELEKDTIFKVFSKIYDFQSDVLNGYRKIVPKNSLPVHLNILRHIEFIQKRYGKNKLKVFEIGSGSSLLGAMILEKGHTYHCSDITQSLYIYQSYLFNYLCSNEFMELALMETEDIEKYDFSEKKCLHIPWWFFSKINQYPNLKKCTYDIVTVNHTLCEMNSKALHYTLNIIKYVFFSNSNNINFLIFEGFGSESQNSIESIMNILYAHGFKFEFFDKKIAILSYSSDNLTNSMYKKMHKKFIRQKNMNQVYEKMKSLLTNDFRKYIKESRKNNRLEHVYTKQSFLQKLNEKYGDCLSEDEEFEIYIKNMVI